MRISNDTFPDLFRDWNNLTNDTSIYIDIKVLSKSIIDAMQNVYFITKPVVDAAYLSLKKIHHLLGDLPDCSRTLLVCNENVNWVYSYRMNSTIINGKDSLLIVGMTSDSKSDPIPIPFYIHKEDIGDRFQPFRYLGQISDEQIELYTPIIGFITCMEVFLNFAEIETKVLPPSRQIYDGVTCLYNNRINRNITIVDSTWFTTLIKSDRFKVRGHFRLQACGEAMSKRKLVWINDFEKEGYTRRAKKIDLE